jgi:Zn-dependent membrane protease YugP
MFLRPVFDIWYFVFLIPPFLLVLWAQFRVNSTYGRYSKVPNAQGITGLAAAGHLLQTNDLSHVNIEGVAGKMSDHYDPQGKTLRLSQGVAHSSSVAALGIVAHEVGHAIQDAQDYKPMHIRAALVPATRIGSYLGYILFFAGLFIGLTGLAWAGIIFFSTSVIFSLLALPVEFNASARALTILKDGSLLDSTELEGAKKVLSAAALTYVAALAQALATLLYYVFLISGSGRRRG